MTDPVQDRRERRLLVLTPTGKDAALARSMLGEEGIECSICPDLESVAREIDEGAAALLLAEEAIQYGSESLAASIRQQPPWSDLPVLILARQGADSVAVAQAIEMLGNVTVLERPIRIAALTSAVRTALRARQRQYHARAHLAERERAARALREADQRKDEFLAMLAHELRNPLAPIRNAVEILRRFGSNEQKRKTATEMIQRQVGQLVRLVDDLLDINRITRAKIELRKEPVELASVVHPAVEAVRPFCESMGHELTVTLPPEPTYLNADPVRLGQVMGNLLNNAFKFTDKGGRIGLAVEREGNQVLIRVQDTGIGIAADQLSRIFGMFTQADTSLERSRDGLGLGLTLVKNLVEMHAGTVEARSPGVGQGSEFVVRLPLLSGPLPPLPREPSSVQPVATAPRRILVVDDNRDSADSLAMLLELTGHEVHIAHDGLEAVEGAAAFQPQVILLDIGLPGLNGYEAARRIREQQRDKAPTLVALTGWGQEQDHGRSEEAGFDAHLVKPVDFAALTKLLAESSAG